MITIDSLRDVLGLIGVACTAGAGIAGIVTMLARGLQRMIRAETERAIAPIAQTVKEELGPNGHEDILPERERGQSLRTLVLWSRADLSETKTRLGRGAALMEDHEHDHLMRDPAWPQRARGLAE